MVTRSEPNTCRNNLNNVRREARWYFRNKMRESINFWDITLCSPLSANRCFEGTYHLRLQGRRNKFSMKPASKQVASRCLTICASWSSSRLTPGFQQFSPVTCKLWLINMFQGSVDYRPSLIPWWPFCICIRAHHHQILGICRSQIFEIKSRRNLD
jgi:hypothetical protein